MLHRARPPRSARLTIFTLLLAACSPGRDPAAGSGNAPAPQVDLPAPVANTSPATPPAPSSSVEADGNPALAVEGDGLRLFNPTTGAARPLPFGTPRATLLAALAFRRSPDTGRQEECGPGPLDFAVWPDGLKLYFQAGKMTGWALDRRARESVSTASGIGPGSTRAALEAAQTISVEQSSLGTEFTSGGISGVLDGTGRTAKITDMWAGASCVMR